MDNSEFVIVAKEFSCCCAFYDEVLLFCWLVIHIDLSLSLSVSGIVLEMFLYTGAICFDK